MKKNEYRYEGTELDIFCLAVKWKEYWARMVRPECRGAVLEVGAGIGANTKLLLNPSVTQWHCLEPDGVLLQRLGNALEAERLVKIKHGILHDVSLDETFDSIIYIDVLEHIADDANELECASRKLKPGGCICVLSPAHPFLYSPFDHAVGHYRRYTRRSLRAIKPAGLFVEKLCYLDSVGLFASLANSLLLRQKNPSKKQVEFWDTYLIPLSARIDGLLGFRFGKSILAVFRKMPATDELPEER